MLKTKQKESKQEGVWLLDIALILLLLLLLFCCVLSDGGA